MLSIFWTPAAAQQSADSFVLPAADTSVREFPDGTVSAGEPSAAEAAAEAVPAADKALTLDECMRYAVEHSPAVRRQDYTNRNYRQDYIESIAALVPSVSGSIGASTSFGRSVDPETNTYTDVSNFDNSYSVSGQMSLFAGLTGINTVRAARVMRLQGVEELQLARDEIALKTMQAYFDVVYYTGSVRLAREQLETSTAELEKSRKLFELGLKSAADVAEVESQQASDDYLLTQQENNLALAEIALAEAMNYPADRQLRIVTDPGIETPAGVAPFDEVLGNALESNPKAVAAQHDVRHSRLQFSIARGNLFPSLYVGGGYSTNFFMNLDDRSLYATFPNQFRDNRGFYVSAQLNIPIFGGLARRTSVSRARNNWRIAEQNRMETLRALQSEVAQAYQQMLGYGKEFVQASKKSDAARLAYEAVSGKYERGMVSALDLQTAADKLLEARSERLRARLQYIIKVRLVAYYNGEPLIR
ncbi:TolC family protein [uncultured Alistipes sp.]|uniref:TolC family protein n=1 Tax=uncultured Alistipes sp. TaxID=538949 RepID=UPI0026184B95|nr:TolC family protein [uncultured Alistipes sp.]